MNCSNGGPGVVFFADSLISSKNFFETYKGQPRNNQAQKIPAKCNANGMI